MVPLERSKLTIKKDAKCPICGEQFMDLEEQKLKKPILSSEELGAVHEACFAPYLGEERVKILFKIRCYSIGDTIAATPALRELRRLYPKTPITVMTFFPDLFKYNPNIQMILDINQPIQESMVQAHHFQIDAFNQDRANHFAYHSVEFSSLCALSKSLIPNDWGYELYYTINDRNRALEVLLEHGIEPTKDKVILIHPHRTEWSTRDWGPHKFPELAKRLRIRYPDHKLVSIGGKREESGRVMKNYVPIEGAIDLFGKLKLLESAALMDFPCMKLLITPDTGTLHLAATRPELPIVGIFTLIKAYLRTPVRNGKFGYKFIGVEAESGCNCTYDAKLLSHEIDFKTCPKRKFYESTARINLPRQSKAVTMADYDPSVSWTPEKVSKQLQEQIKIYQPDNLPCFPSVERVMKAVERLLG